MMEVIGFREIFSKSSIIFNFGFSLHEFLKNPVYVVILGEILIIFTFDFNMLNYVSFLRMNGNSQSMLRSFASHNWPITFIDIFRHSEIWANLLVGNVSRILVDRNGRYHFWVCYFKLCFLNLEVNQSPILQFFRFWEIIVKVEANDAWQGAVRFQQQVLRELIYHLLYIKELVVSHCLPLGRLFCLHTSKSQDIVSAGTCQARCACKCGKSAWSLNNRECGQVLVWRTRPSSAHLR